MMGSGPTPVDLTGRDRQVVQLIARFKQASSRQVHELLFHGVSFTPADRVLRRLSTPRGVDRPFLTRIERRSVGGSRGGSGQYVYGLAPRGFALHFVGRYSAWRTVNYHALAILDAYIAVKRLERAGRLEILGLSTEPDCWVRVGGDELKPDMYIELRRTPTERLKLWFEVDMGSEGQKQLRDKLARYWRAYNEADWEVFPLVLWVAVDDERAKELRWLIEQLPADARALFSVTTLAELPTVFGA